jgi:hypothetical protein
VIKRPLINGGISGEISTQIAQRYANHGRDTSSPVIIWAGANNNWETEVVKADIRRMVGTNKHFLILELMCGSLPERWKGSPYYENNIKLNNDLATEYGEEHFVWIKKELQKYMVNRQDSIDVFEHDAVPTSLRSDWLHHNNLANQKIAALLAERLKCNR